MYLNNSIENDPHEIAFVLIYVSQIPMDIKKYKI